MITPVNGRLLVQTKGKYKHLDTSKEKYGASDTRGVVLAIAESCQKDCKELRIKVGGLVYFGAWEDSARYGTDDDQILIKLEDIGGWSEE